MKFPNDDKCNFQMIISSGSIKMSKTIGSMIVPNGTLQQGAEMSPPPPCCSLKPTLLIGRKQCKTTFAIPTSLSSRPRKMPWLMISTTTDRSRMHNKVTVCYPFQASGIIKTKYIRSLNWAWYRLKLFWTAYIHQQPPQLWLCHLLKHLSLKRVCVTGK